MVLRRTSGIAQGKPIIEVTNLSGFYYIRFRRPRIEPPTSTLCARVDLGGQTQIPLGHRMACWRYPTGGVREALIKVAFSYLPDPAETAVAAQAGVPDAHNSYRDRTCGAHQI